MSDERHATYMRLATSLLKMPGVRVMQSPDPAIAGAYVSVQDVVLLLAEEFLVERRGTPPIEIGATYRIDQAPDAAIGLTITCLLCGMTSYHPADVTNRFCCSCNVFHT